MKITEKDVIDTIERVLSENKTFLKLGNQGSNNAAPMPPMDNAMVGGADPMMGADPNAAGGAPMDMGVDPMAGSDANAAGNDANQFDSNFDAGVEADEDSDPKKYIQQLTGKLSQKLNSYSSEQGDDAETAKYVGQMIIKAVSKMLDDDDKKDLIKTINTTDNETDDNDSDDSQGSDGVDNGNMAPDDMGGQDMPADSNMQQPMMEMMFTKKDITKMLMEQFNDIPMDTQGQEAERPRETNKKIEYGPFAAKRFMKR